MVTGLSAMDVNYKRLSLVSSNKSSGFLVVYASIIVLSILEQFIKQTNL